MSRLPQVCLCIFVGVLPLLWLPGIPPLSAIILILLIAVGLSAGLPWPWAHYAGIILVSLCWAMLSGKQHLSTLESISGTEKNVLVHIVESEGERHVGKIIRWQNRRVPGSPRVILYGNVTGPVCAGQTWEITAAFRPVHGQYNDTGFSRQRYAMATHTLFSGRMMAVSIVDAACERRAQITQSVLHETLSLPHGPVIRALLFGERTHLSSEVKERLRRTGTAHLMAISGLHIAQAAGLGWLLARAVQLLLPQSWRHHTQPVIIGILIAGSYTWLSGGNPPAVRSLVALITWASVRLLYRQWPAWNVWIVCVGMVLLRDPLTVLSDSFWLSAFAVAALIFWCQWIPAPCRHRHVLIRGMVAMCHLQFGASLLLLPLQIPLFQGMSLISLPANLLAVPVVTLLIVPLLFLGLLLTPFGGAQTLWWLVDYALEILFLVMDWLPQGWLWLDKRYLWLSGLPWIGVIAWRLRLWLTSPLTTLVAVLLIARPLWLKLPGADWAVHMLDIGHGLAVVIEREGHVWLYDTGHRWEAGDHGNQVITPWLRWHNLMPEGMTISHEHADHYGGASSLLAAWPGEWAVRRNTGHPGALPCITGERWQWRGLDFHVLWPPENYRGNENNRSCVIRVSDGLSSILLTGDLELPAELLLTRDAAAQLASDIVQVPHHGSRTSSGLRFVGRVQGQVALASVARYNAWRMPARDVVQRYQTYGYQWHDTASDGQISVTFTGGKWRIHSKRKHIYTPWYQRRFGVPADNG